MARVVSVKSLSSMRRMVSAEPREIGGWWPTPLGVMHTRSGGGDVTSWMDRVGEWGMYWTNKLVDEIEMWQVCWSLNSWRSWVAKAVSSLMRVASSWFIDVGELIDGLELLDILYLWNMQRGSRQKAA